MVYIYSLPDAPGARYIIGVELELEKELELSHSCEQGALVVPEQTGPTTTSTRECAPVRSHRHNV